MRMTRHSDFIQQLKERYLPAGNEERLIFRRFSTARMPGARMSRPEGNFFTALYTALGVDPDICTVTFSEFLDGNPRRGVRSHPLREQERVCDLAYASWIDECGSRPGNDLGTWIGEPGECGLGFTTRGARMLSTLRHHAADASAGVRGDLRRSGRGATRFWWYEAATRRAIDPNRFSTIYFGKHLRSAYILAGMSPPAELDRNLVPRKSRLGPSRIKRRPSPNMTACASKVGCPGLLTWSVDGWKDVKKTTLSPSGGEWPG